MHGKTFRELDVYERVAAVIATNSNNDDDTHSDKYG